MTDLLKQMQEDMQQAKFRSNCAKVVPELCKQFGEALRERGIPLDNEVVVPVLLAMAVRQLLPNDERALDLSTALLSYAAPTASGAIEDVIKTANEEGGNETAEH